MSVEIGNVRVEGEWGGSWLVHTRRWAFSLGPADEVGGFEVRRIQEALHLFGFGLHGIVERRLKNA